MKNKNNNKKLKAGEGKLMMTNGISISEFLRKYKLWLVIKCSNESYRRFC